MFLFDSVKKRNRDTHGNFRWKSSQDQHYCHSIHRTLCDSNEENRSVLRKWAKSSVFSATSTSRCVKTISAQKKSYQMIPVNKTLYRCEPILERIQFLFLCSTCASMIYVNELSIREFSACWNRVDNVWEVVDEICFSKSWTDRGKSLFDYSISNARLCSTLLWNNFFCHSEFSTKSDYEFIFFFLFIVWIWLV